MVKSFPFVFFFRLSSLYCPTATHNKIIIPILLFNLHQFMFNNISISLWNMKDLWFSLTMISDRQHIVNNIIVCFKFSFRTRLLFYLAMFLFLIKPEFLILKRSQNLLRKKRKQSISSSNYLLHIHNTFYVALTMLKLVEEIFCWFHSTRWYITI